MTADDCRLSRPSPSAQYAAIPYAADDCRLSPARIYGEYRVMSSQSGGDDNRNRPPYLRPLRQKPPRPPRPPHPDFWPSIDPIQKVRAFPIKSACTFDQKCVHFQSQSACTFFCRVPPSSPLDGLGLLCYHYLETWTRHDATCAFVQVNGYAKDY
jgi:hypothetical protein